MHNSTILLTLATSLVLGACANPSGLTEREVRINIEQALTGETTAAGTFTLAGGKSDAGSTTEAITFGGPLDAPTVPLTFVRVLTGEHGTITISGSAVLTWTSATAGTLSGEWEIDDATGAYSTGSGTLTGTANFEFAPPTASITYFGRIKS